MIVLRLRGLQITAVAMTANSIVKGLDVFGNKFASMGKILVLKAIKPFPFTGILPMTSFSRIAWFDFT